MKKSTAAAGDLSLRFHRSPSILCSGTVRGMFYVATAVLEQPGACLRDRPFVRVHCVGEEYCMEQPSPGIGVVSGETLVYQLEAQELIVPVGSPTWYAWLEQAHSFSFRSDAGTFTAHKARASNRRGGWYWYAYCHRH